MDQTKTILEGIADVVRHITDVLLGDKYYCVVVGTRGSEQYFITSDIFPSREAAMRRREELSSNSSYYYVEMHSFRSKRLKLRRR